MADKAFVFANGAPSNNCYGGAKPAVISPIANYIEPPDHPLSEAAETGLLCNQKSYWTICSHKPAGYNNRNIIQKAKEV